MTEALKKRVAIYRSQKGGPAVKQIVKMTKGKAILSTILFAIISSPAYGDEVKIGDGTIIINDDGIKIGDSITVDESGVSTPGIKIKADKKEVTVSGDGVAWQGGDISGGNYSGQDFSGEVFSNIDIVGANFSGANFSGAKFTNVDISGADFSNTNLSGVEFTNYNFDGVRFDNANLSFGKIANGDFINVLMREACLLNASFTNSDFIGGDLSGSYTVGVSYTHVDYEGTRRENMVNSGPQSCPGRQVSKQKTAPAPVVIKRPELTKADRIEEALEQGKGSEISLTVNFDHDSDRIIGAARAQIYEIAKALKSDKISGMRICVEGHTDSTGDEQYNGDLSYRRALSVIKTLKNEYQISDKNLEIAGLGESQPIADNETMSGRAINRRVTLVNLGPVGG